jgi:23S rRNA (cytidine1920-2'-O)/16S rRNA (cytidine1409-2'-O)-methyltransferase
VKKRIDILLFERGITKSREKAKTQIIAGNVMANGQPVNTPSQTFEEDVDIELKVDSCPYVSRGGLKLEKAIVEFDIDLNGKICADIGASTGGFTDCMLKNRAKRVYAVDVGYGQFDWSLRNDGRVRLFERTNARYLEGFEDKIDFVSIDVSFISLSHIIPAAIRICGGNADIVALIKPQFEAGKEKVGKKGVVRDERTHMEVIRNVGGFAVDNGLTITSLSFSPVKGPNGNIEYLARMQNCGISPSKAIDIESVVKKAHESLN